MFFPANINVKLRPANLKKTYLFSARLEIGAKMLKNTT
jgi:hypothetical protein